MGVHLFSKIGALIKSFVHNLNNISKDIFSQMHHMHHKCSCTVSFVQSLRKSYYEDIMVPAYMVHYDHQISLHFFINRYITSRYFFVPAMDFKGRGHRHVLCRTRPRGLLLAWSFSYELNMLRQKQSWYIFTGSHYNSSGSSYHPPDYVNSSLTPCRLGDSRITEGTSSCMSNTPSPPQVNTKHFHL